MDKGVWMRICDLDGIEQSSVMVIGDYTLYMHSFEDNQPMLIDYTHELGAAAENAEALVGLAKRLQRPDEHAHLFANAGAQLFKAPA